MSHTFSGALTDSSEEVGPKERGGQPSLPKSVTRAVKREEQKGNIPPLGVGKNREVRRRREETNKMVRETAISFLLPIKTRMSAWTWCQDMNLMETRHLVLVPHLSLVESKTVALINSPISRI